MRASYDGSDIPHPNPHDITNRRRHFVYVLQGDSGWSYGVFSSLDEAIRQAPHREWWFFSNGTHNMPPTWIGGGDGRLYIYRHELDSPWLTEELRAREKPETQWAVDQ